MTQSTPLTTSVSHAGSQASSRQLARRKTLEGLGRWSFVLPILALNLVVIVIPTLFSFYIAFTEWSGLGTPEFIGLKNFQELLQDGVFF